MFSIDGLVSGFDTTSIIEGILQFQQVQLDNFNTRKAEIATRQAAFGGIEGQLLSLRSALGKLNRTSSVFDATTATSSNTDILNATADSSASGGTFTLTVNSLAKAQQVASQGYSSDSAEIGTGEFSLRVGSNEVTTIQIDETNNTLDGLVNAINDQSDDVSASIIFDQGADAYRVLLASNETGESNTISITSDLSGGDAPVFDFDEPVQAATNASVTLGSGAGAITAEYSTNQIEGLISGVTIDLVSADAGQSVTVTVDADTQAVKDAVSEFVDAYNGLIDFIDSQTAFDAETNAASPLLGNRNVTRIKNNLLNAVIENVQGLDSGISRLADIGVDINTDGKLELDSQKLDDALSGNIEGLDPSELRNLFGLNGTSTNSGIQFLAGSDNTLATGEAFQVDIEQAAEQATITATNTLSESTVIDESNNEFTIAFSEDTETTFTIPTGTYSREELAATLESVINNSSADGAVEVNVSLEGDALAITTEAYGSTAQISRSSGTAAAVLGFDGTENDTGVDVAGRFIVNGVVETAVGRGRVLTSEEDNEFTADVQVVVSLSPEQVSSDVEGDLTVTRGVTSQLDLILSEALDPVNGTLKTINDEFDSQIESIDESIDRVNEIVESRREALIAEFAALETTLANLQNTGNIIASQFANLSSFSSNN